jgi:hypothetical protein
MCAGVGESLVLVLSHGSEIESRYLLAAQGGTKASRHSEAGLGRLESRPAVSLANVAQSSSSNTKLCGSSSIVSDRSGIQPSPSLLQTKRPRSCFRRRRRRLLAVEGGQEGAERFHENYARCEYRLGHTFGLPQEIVGPSFQSHTHTGLTRRENAHCLLQSIIRRLVVRGAQSNSAQSISNIDGFNRQQLG